MRFYVWICSKCGEPLRDTFRTAKSKTAAQEAMRSFIEEHDIDEHGDDGDAMSGRVVVLEEKKSKRTVGTAR